MMLRDTPAKSVCARAMQSVATCVPAAAACVGPAGRRQPFWPAWQPWIGHAGKGSGGVRFVGIVVDASGRGKPCGFQSVFCVPAYGRQSWEEGAP